MSDLSNAERETCLNMTADNRSEWEAYTDDPVMQRRFESIGAELIAEVYGGGKRYRLRANQILLRRGKRRLSEATKAKLSERLRSARKSQ